MCNCIKESEERCKERLMKEHNIKEEDIESGGFENGAFIFSKNTKFVLSNKYELSYYKTKTNGERYKSKTIEKINLLPTYCSTCGEKFDYSK